MKSFALAALLIVAAATTGAVSVKADTFTIHGFEGTSYGR